MHAGDPAQHLVASADGVGIPASDVNDGGLLIGGLSGSDTYSFYLVTAYQGNLSGPSNVVSPSRAATVPTGLTGQTIATSYGDGQCESIFGPTCVIQLTWNAVTGADHYNVYRRLTSAGQTSYSYVGASYGTTYDMGLGTLAQLQASYEIETVRGDGGVSAPSSAVTLTIGDYGGDGTGCYLLTQVPYESGAPCISTHRPTAQTDRLTTRPSTATAWSPAWRRPTPWRTSASAPPAAHSRRSRPGAGRTATAPAAR
jgi:hypothetical protein